MKNHDDTRHYEDTRRPEEIEHDIERTREQLSSNIDAIQRKLTPGEMMDEAITYARTSLPADFGSNLNHAVRENPIPVALIGLGVAWLMMSGRQRPGYMNSHRDAGSHVSVPHRPGSGFASEHGLHFGGQGDVDDHGVGNHVTGDHSSTMHNAASKASATGRSLKEKASSMTQGVKQRISDTAQRVSDTSHSWRDSASSSGQGMRERMNATGQNLRERANDLSHRFSDSTSHMGERSRDMMQGARMRASDLGQRSQQQYYRAKDNFSHMAEEQPLLLGALGLAVGSVIGALLPATRREDELMGHTRDDLMARGQQVAREQADQLQASAKRVVDTAQQEAQRMKHGSEGRQSGENGSGQTFHRDDNGDEMGRDSRSLH